MIWLGTAEKTLENKVLEEISIDEAWKHVEWLAKVRHRLGGTLPAEKAVEYVKKTLQSYGIPVDVFEFDAYVSFPKESGLKVLSPEQKVIECASRAFCGSTSENGIQGELVDAKFGDEETYKKTSVEGKIALVDQWIGAAKVRLAEEHGAIGMVVISQGTAEDTTRRAIEKKTVRDVWGNPTPESMKEVPRKIPVLSISRADGFYLKDLCRRGEVSIWLRGGSTEQWVKCSEPIAFIKGAKEPEKIVLLSGHLDAWDMGVTDNALGDACMLEVARVLLKHTTQLRRSLRIAWWNCHENLYDGSTWYLDNFWEDLDSSLIAHYNCDSLGMIGTKQWTSMNSIEIRKFEEENAKDVLGEVVKNLPPDRAADNSFAGIGSPFVMMYTDYPARILEEVGGWYGGWWLHSDEDTIDKVDKGAFGRALKMYTATMLRLCCCPILPLEFVSLADEVIDTLRNFQGAAKGKFDLASVAKRAEEFKSVTIQLEETAGKLISKYAAAVNEGTEEDYEPAVRKINDCLMRLGRILTPGLYSITGRYGQDKMGDYQKPLPVLQPISKLAAMDVQSAEFKALRTDLVRQRNKVSDALKAASSIAKETLAEIASLTQ